MAHAEFYHQLPYYAQGREMSAQLPERNLVWQHTNLLGKFKVGKCPILFQLSIGIGHNGYMPEAECQNTFIVGQQFALSRPERAGRGYKELQSYCQESRKIKIHLKFKFVLLSNASNIIRQAQELWRSPSWALERSSCPASAVPGTTLSWKPHRRRY